MRQRYFDSAATTRPKAPGVSEAAADFLDRVCCNIGRGDYQSAYDAENVALEVREKLCALLGGPAPQNVISRLAAPTPSTMSSRASWSPGTGRPSPPWSTTPCCVR